MRLAVTLALLAGCSMITLHKERFAPLEITSSDAAPDDDVARRGKSDNGSTRNDIIARMASARAPIAACYATALRGFAKMGGEIEVDVQVAAKTGEFEHVQIVRDDLGDPTLNDCVVDQIGQLKLAKPTMTKLSFRYPLHFTPPAKQGAR